jgi:hypothetical protein
LLWHLGERSHDATDRAGDRAGKTRYQLGDHLRHPLAADSLHLRGGVGFICRELGRGIGRTRPSVQVGLGAGLYVAGHTNVASGE